MAIKHPPKDKLLFEVGQAYRVCGLDPDAHTVEAITDTVITLYDLENLDDPPVRTASVIGKMYQEFRAQGRSDGEAMRLMELTLKLGMLERADVMEKFKAQMEAGLQHFLARAAQHKPTP